MKGIVGYGDAPQRVCIACRDTLAAIKETGSSRPRERRMIVAGAHQSGKTSLCCAIDKALGDPVSTNHTKPIKYRGSEYSVHVVDIDGGPEVFRLPSTVGVHAFVVLFNVGERSDLQSVQQLLDRIALSGPGRLVVVAGHKLDGVPRAVTVEEGKLFATKNSCVYRELSSRSHHEAVDFLNDIVARIADSEG